MHSEVSEKASEDTVELSSDTKAFMYTFSYFD